MKRENISRPVGNYETEGVKVPPKPGPSVDIQFPETMTVAQLIEALQQCDPKAYVVTEGCDCYGQAKGVVQTQEADGLCVEIKR